jgi:hypothetical protein
MAQSLASAAEQQHSSLSNSAARAETIRSAVQWLAERDAEVKALHAEINEFKSKTIRGELGFKLADWNAIYRVSQLEVEDRDTLLETIREGFAALHIGGVMDWVAAAETAERRRGNGAAAPDDNARRLGRIDGLNGGHDYADEYPQGEPGHADYMLGLADGEAERERVMALGNGAEQPQRRRGRPRKQRQEAEADAEF